MSMEGGREGEGREGGNSLSNLHPCQVLQVPLHQRFVSEIPTVPNHKCQIRCETHNSHLIQENDQNVHRPSKEDVTNGVTPESLQFRIRCPPLSLLALILTPSFNAILFPLKLCHSPYHPFPSLLANP